MRFEISPNNCGFFVRGSVGDPLDKDMDPNVKLTVMEIILVSRAILTGYSLNNTAECNSSQCAPSFIRNPRNGHPCYREWNRRALLDSVVAFLGTAPPWVIRLRIFAPKSVVSVLDYSPVQNYMCILMRVTR